MSIKTVAGLAEAGLVAHGQMAELETVAQSYAIGISPAILQLIDRDDPSDPIAAQFVPDPRELVQLPEERVDPIGDHAHSPVEGLVHRYPDRVLLKAVHVCPVYCRFCFRREMVGPKGDGMLSEAALVRAYDYIKANSQIWEVIVTGGDPLILSPRRLAALLAPLKEIAHVKVLRFHSRVPVVAPDLIGEEMIAALQSAGKMVTVAVHANHPRELTREARAACRALHLGGVSLVSQTVLLKGVNDRVGVLAELMRGFVETGIKPYYLHHPDLAPGTSHFRMSIAEGQALVAALRGQLSGLCQPTYVLDIPGGYGKVDIGQSPILLRDDGTALVTDWQGNEHVYPPAILDP